MATLWMSLGDRDALQALLLPPRELEKTWSGDSLRGLSGPGASSLDRKKQTLFHKMEPQDRKPCSIDQKLNFDPYILLLFSISFLFERQQEIEKDIFYP